jgi:hypothetical protein
MFHVTEYSIESSNFISCHISSTALYSQTISVYVSLKFEIPSNVKSFVHFHFLDKIRKVKSSLTLRKKVQTLFAVGQGGPQDSETSRASHFVYIWLTDGDDVVSVTRRLRLHPERFSGTHFCSRLSQP